jgi:hypothetical protein
VFQQLEVSKKITVASPETIEPSEVLPLDWIRKFGLESSSKERWPSRFDEFL